MAPPSRGLLVDYGGVMTTNVFDSFRAFCLAEGLPRDAFLKMMRDDSEARRQLRRMETGEIDERAFGAIVGEKLGVPETDGLVDRLFAGMRPEPTMIAAVRAARDAGVRTGLVSNSMGAGRYDRATFAELYDTVVISGEVGLHKPQLEIYALAADRLEVPARDCVFVDDLRQNCAGAIGAGMTAVLHRGPERTIPELERLLGVELAAAG